MVMPLKLIDIEQIQNYFLLDDSLERKLSSLYKVVITVC